MKMQLALLTLAMIGVAGIAQAQSGTLVTNGPQVSPGDYTRERPGLQPPDNQSQAVSPRHGTVPHDTAFKDEYGFRYDERGERIDSAGRRISPHTMQP